MNDGDPRCGTCKFFRNGPPEVVVEDGDEREVDYHIGSCLRFPPVLIKVLEGKDCLWSNPEVYQSHYCGEWQWDPTR